jgi:hypothetical protein
LVNAPSLHLHWFATARVWDCLSLAAPLLTMGSDLGIRRNRMVVVTWCLSLGGFTQDTLHDVLCMLGCTACYFYIGDQQAEAIWWGSMSLRMMCWVIGLLHGGSVLHDM